jgi:hypothetical protein
LLYARHLADEKKLKTVNNDPLIAVRIRTVSLSRRIQWMRR